jgi:hypothetical protein
MYEKIPDCAKSTATEVSCKKKKNGDYFEKLSIPLTETGGNRDHRSETRRKTKQMRKEKRSIRFEPLYKCKNLTPNLQEKKESKTAKTVREPRTKFREKEGKKHSRRYTRKFWTVQKARQPKSPAKKRKEKNGDYFDRLSMTLTNLTRRNKDYRSKTRRKTKLQQQQQMREEK